MYAEHYGLRDLPFQLTPDPRFYFESATHKKAMAYLGYGLAQGEGFIVITGEIGAGKTTLVGHLMATIDTARLTAIRIVSTQVEGDDMLRLVAQGLGLSSQGAAKAQLLDRIESALHAQSREGKRTLLVVDEAQNLPFSALEELRMLSNFQLGGRALVQIFLLGQPEFRAALASERLEQLRQRVIATHHLTPMEDREIAAYIAHRLARAGWRDGELFTADACAALHRFSGGTPRRLNMLASRALLHGAVEGLSRIDGRAVEAVAAEMASEGQPRGAAQQRVQPEPEPRISFAFAEPEPQPTAYDEKQMVQLEALQARLDEQERALRRVLSLLLDWIERDDTRLPATPRSSVG